MGKRASLLLVLGAGWLAAATCPSLAGMTVEVVSSPPGLVTAPDVLVRVSGAVGVPRGWASNDTLVTPFVEDESGDWFGLIGTMDYLIPGENHLTLVDDANRSDIVTLTIVVHASDQALFEGPRPASEPCRDGGLRLAAAAGGCGPFLPAVTYVYRTERRGWAPYAIGAPRPQDMATARSNDGRDLGLIVRIETGMVGRVPYALAFLDDPASRVPAPGARLPGWNGVLVYDAAAPVALADLAGGPAPGTAGCWEVLVMQGFAVAAAGTALGPAVNDIVAAEAILRLRERFAKRYGVPEAVVGVGEGEGRSALDRIAARYPGLDAVVTPGRAATDPVPAAVARLCGVGGPPV